LAVSETEIREARKMVSELEGIDCCFTASVAVAGLKRAAACGQVNPKDVILLNLTGADRPAMPPLRNVCYLQRTPEGWKSETGERSELF
jgi:threonine synthase